MTHKRPYIPIKPKAINLEDYPASVTLPTGETINITQLLIDALDNRESGSYTSHNIDMHSMNRPRLVSRFNHDS